MTARKPVLFDISPTAPVVRCGSCAAAIVWIVTVKGRRMPVDAVGATRGQSHFSTCPQASEWRRSR